MLFRLIIKEKFFLSIICMMLLFLTLYFYNITVNISYNRSPSTRMRMAVVSTLGGPAVPIIAQCCTSRNLTEGIYARRSDFPGGFCFHSDCDTVFTPKAVSENVYEFSIIKKP